MSQIYLGDKIIASTLGSDIKYDENTSVNDKIDEHATLIDEQNKNFAKSTNNWAEAYANAKIKIDVCLEYYYTNKYITLTITIPVNKMAIGKSYASGYYFNASSNAVAEVTIKSSTELTKVVYIKELGQTITNTTFIYY